MISKKRYTSSRRISSPAHTVAARISHHLCHRVTQGVDNGERVDQGAIFVDTTVQPMPGAGNPFGYFTQEQVEEQDDADIARMVAEYPPDAPSVSLA